MRVAALPRPPPRWLPFALARLLLDLIPVAVFAGIGNLLAAIVAEGTNRLVILVLVNAYVAYRVVLAFGDMLISPRLGRLRLIYIDDSHADYAIGWLGRIAGVVLGGGRRDGPAGLDLGTPQMIPRRGWDGCWRFS
jgi:hypothetical protein